MEIFHFVEHSFDFDLINKSKTQLGSKSIKKINIYLRKLVQSEIPSNNLKFTINIEKNNNKIEYLFEENVNNKQIIENFDKDNTTSGAENSEG